MRKFILNLSRISHPAPLVAAMVGAGPELVSRPIKGHQKEISLGWIQSANSTMTEEAAAFIEEAKRVLNLSSEKR